MKSTSPLEILVGVMTPFYIFILFYLLLEGVIVRYYFQMWLLWQQVSNVEVQRRLKLELMEQTLTNNPKDVINHQIVRTQINMY